MNAYNAAELIVTEPLLNLAWFAVALVGTGWLLARRRDGRALAALLCALALLFPIISVTDDFSGGTSLEEIVAILTAIAAGVALTALFRLAAATSVVAPIHRTVSSDPRSPPRG